MSTKGRTADAILKAKLFGEGAKRKISTQLTLTITLMYIFQVISFSFFFLEDVVSVNATALKGLQYFCEKSPSFLLGVCYNLAICEHTGLKRGIHIVSPDAIFHCNYQK